MIKYCECGNEINEKRVNLNYSTCLECGDLEAKKEIEAKSKRVGLNCNKGTYVYLGDEKDSRKAMLDVGRKDGGLAKQDIATLVIPVVKKRAKINQPKKKYKGIQRINGELKIIWE